MAFMNEKIPSEVKETLPLSVQRSPFDGSAPTLWKWTIDRAREAYLVCTGKEGGSYEGTQLTESYALVWRGQVVTFGGDPTRTTGPQGAVSLRWRIYGLQIPETLRDREQEVVAMITEALDAKGFLFDRTCLASVDVHFDAANE